jgi:hypothetical protein
VLDRDEFYRRYPPSAFVQAVSERRSRTGILAPIFAYTAGGAFAAAAAVVLFLVLPPAETVRDLPSGTTEQVLEFGTAGKTTSKGAESLDPVSARAPGPVLRLNVLASGEFQAVVAGQPLHAGDVIRFHYDSAEHDYLFLFGVDAQGKITPYYPDAETSSIPIVRGRNIPLPEAVQLDGYVGQERFFALFSKDPIGFETIEAAVRLSLARLAAQGKGADELSRLPLPCDQALLVVEKR